MLIKRATDIDYTVEMSPVGSDDDTASQPVIGLLQGLGNPLFITICYQSGYQAIETRPGQNLLRTVLSFSQENAL